MEKLSLGLSTTAIGMLVVFFGLAILIGCIYVLSCFTKRAKQQPEKKPETEAAPAPVVEEAEEADDSELIAVISAAIAAVWDKQDSGFVVRRVRRIETSTARARAARDEQIYNRF